MNTRCEFHGEALIEKDDWDDKDWRYCDDWPMNDGTYDETRWSVEDECGCERERMSPREIGLRGEEAASKYLVHQGYTILERNWACPFGEADIIALGPNDDELVFVEVKTRSTEAAGLPEEAVGPAKRRRYESIALAYLRDCDLRDIAICFDIIGITLAGVDRAFLRHHHRAFGIGE